MSIGVNMHDYVRDAIEYLHPDEDVILYKSQGYTNDRGIVTPLYAEPETIRAQIQGSGDVSLAHDNHVNTAQDNKKFWLYTDVPNPVYTINRPHARGGDMIYRLLDGTWWLVTAVSDAFARVGWESVTCALQMNPPKGIELP